MSWYKIATSPTNKEDLGSQIRDAVFQLTLRSAYPKGFVFADDGHSSTYYFTPVAALYCPEILSRFEAVRCDRPELVLRPLNGDGPFLMTPHNQEGDLKED